MCGKEMTMYLRFPSNHLKNILQNVCIISWKPYMIIVRNPCGLCCANANYPHKKKEITQQVSYFLS